MLKSEIQTARNQLKWKKINKNRMLNTHQKEDEAKTAWSGETK